MKRRSILLAASAFSLVKDLSPAILLAVCGAFCWPNGLDVVAADPAALVPALGQGTMAGEVTDRSALVQTRLTAGKELDDRGDLAGASGTVSFEWSTDRDFTDARRTPFRQAASQRDYIVRAELTGLQPGTKYYYRAIFGTSEPTARPGPVCSFRTLPGPASTRTVRLIVGSCMNYNKFMHGLAGNAGGPITATDEDKRLGFPAFVAMAQRRPDFFVGTGDIVYYDNPYRVSKTTEELRRCWHEQFRFQRMIDFFQSVPTYWSKDDHDFRYNDSDNESTRLPLPKTGIDMFLEQLPIAPFDAADAKTYRTYRVSRDLQIWLTEGRDYRSPNKLDDGPMKSLWGREQRDWLRSTLAASDARWKLLISPTPMVGPDMGRKRDNHVSPDGFRHEAGKFFTWLKTTGVDNLFLVCGDRHWQYHSVHPSGVNEFACGALNDENSRVGVAPGEAGGSDPDARVRQIYTSATPSGGFLEVVAGEKLDVTFRDDHGKELYHVAFTSS